MQEPGHKMNILLIRGLSRETRHWAEFPDKLRESGFVGNLTLLDLPGNGLHHKLKAPLKISEYTDFLRTEWLKTSPVGSSGIIGISLGGMVALDWASRFSDFQQAVIINSSSSSHTGMQQRLRFKSLTAILGILFSPSIANRERKILELTVNEQKIAENYSKQWGILGAQFPIRRINLLRQLFAAGRFAPDPVHDCRLLFVRSTGDRLVDPQCTAFLHRFLGGRLVTHETAGHDIPLEDPKWLIEQIVKELASC
jgi:pimeloyl-ACP methyl ester carboxylesterase